MAYQKTTWTTQVPITADNLNNIENGVSANDTSIGDITELETTATDLVNAINEINVNVPIILFESENGEQGEITLSDGKSNYQYIEILAKSNGGNIFSQKIMTNFSQFQLSVIDDNAAPSSSKLWLKWGKYNLNATTIVPIYQGWTEVSANPTTTFISSDFIIFTVYKILGYK